MFTVCSKCNLRLTVTATDLRAAQGYVRCGRCQNVFNALAALADDPVRAAEPAPVADTSNRLAQITPPEPKPEPRPEPAPQAAPDTSLEFNPASTNINEVFIEAGRAENTGTFESIVLSAEEATPPPASAHTPAPPDRVEAAPVSEPTSAQTAAAEESAFNSIWGSPPGGIEQPAVTPAAVTEISNALDGSNVREAAVAASPLTEFSGPPEADFLRPRREVSGDLRWPAHVLAVLLVGGLLSQVLHHYRGALADTALLHRPVLALYAGLGMPLASPWDIANYEIRQLGASTDGTAAGNLVVRASIANRAAREQPLPLLRVVMQDRFGNRVAGRDLIPGEYLGAAAAQSGVMAAGQRVDVQVALRDPGQAATGFELDVCMVGENHNVTCANDAAGR